MRFNPHLELEGAHAFLSPSKYHWVNDNEEKLANRYSNYKAVQTGVELHDFASHAIKKRIKLARYKKALYMFVNDAIGYNMESEQMLYYSPYCFGTADAICFRDNHLRVFDLKTGVSKPSFIQLDTYAAIFCLEYGQDPEAITIELRIYQGAGYEERFPDPVEIRYIMEKIVDFTHLLNEIDSSL